MNNNDVDNIGDTLVQVLHKQVAAYVGKQLGEVGTFFVKAKI